jgi:hypothetical protein
MTHLQRITPAVALAALALLGAAALLAVLAVGDLPIAGIVFNAID